MSNITKVFGRPEQPSLNKNRTEECLRHFFMSDPITQGEAKGGKRIHSGWAEKKNVLLITKL